MFGHQHDEYRRSKREKDTLKEAGFQITAELLS
jgi:hypothetical protein